MALVAVSLAEIRGLECVRRVSWVSEKNLSELYCKTFTFLLVCKNRPQLYLREKRQRTSLRGR
jgi:hypothetical protein